MGLLSKGLYSRSFLQDHPEWRAFEEAVHQVLGDRLDVELGSGVVLADLGLALPAQRGGRQTSFHGTEARCQAGGARRSKRHFLGGGRGRRAVSTRSYDGVRLRL